LEHKFQHNFLQQSKIDYRLIQDIQRKIAKELNINPKQYYYHYKFDLDPHQLKIQHQQVIQRIKYLRIMPMYID